MAKKTTLNFCFHNPNTPEATADYIIPILIEANRKKLDRVIAEEAAQYENEEIINEKGRCVI